MIEDEDGTDMEQEQTQGDDGGGNNHYRHGCPRNFLTTRETSFIGLVTLHASPIDTLAVISR